MGRYNMKNETKVWMFAVTFVVGIIVGVSIGRKITNTEEPNFVREEKPVIYLYPTEPTDVQVKLDFNGELTTFYPSYSDSEGWQVKARPDGTLLDKNGRTYPYLFWEGESDIEFDLSKGAIVAKEDTISLLEEKLSFLGLNEKEQTDFISYWLPRLQESPYNYITFQTTAYTDNAKLLVTPQPDSVIRVYMVYEKLGSKNYYVEPQILTPIERKGFTVVEWG